MAPGAAPAARRMARGGRAPRQLRGPAGRHAAARGESAFDLRDPRFMQYSIHLRMAFRMYAEWTAVPMLLPYLQYMPAIAIVLQRHLSVHGAR